jgi:RNA polymerase sigma-32 factor
MSRLPVLTSDSGLKRYLQEIRKFPLLSEDEEYMLAKRFHEHGDVAAAHKLVTSHLRLVAKIAGQYRGYGLPASELVAEGNIGLMQAVKRFDPERGFRLATYAMWWIKASIQEYVLRSWSLVKIGSSAAQKKLFFGLRKMKNKLRIGENPSASPVLTPQEVKEIARKMGVNEEDVVDMDTRMSAHDQYLNAPIGGEEGESQWQDLLADPSDTHEERLGQAQEQGIRHGQLEKALGKLNVREQAIIRERKLKDEPATLEDLSKTFNISRERVRQIESRAMEKLQKEMVADAATAAG